MFDFMGNKLALTVLTAASLISLLLLILKALGKEFESTAIVWIRAWRKVQTERSKSPPQ
jgi:hypothetical protein